MLNFNRLFFCDNRVKCFVDAFEENGEFYTNLYVFDPVNKDFMTRTTRSASTTIHDAKYDAAILLCRMITDARSVTIYTDYKVLINHLNETYKVRSPSLKKKYREVEALVRKGLKVEYVEPEYNMARISPYTFKFYYLFDVYDRKNAFFAKKGEIFDIKAESDDTA